MKPIVPIAEVSGSSTPTNKSRHREASIRLKTMEDICMETLQPDDYIIRCTSYHR